MNPLALMTLARELDLEDEEHFRLRVAFGVACIERVEHLLTESSVINALSIAKGYVSGVFDEHKLREAAIEAKETANSHPGSGSIDGSGSAAVSTSHGVAAALAGQALKAAEYAAYASVYSYASHAVTDMTAYADEHTWQTNKLRELATNFGVKVNST